MEESALKRAATQADIEDFVSSSKNPFHNDAWEQQGVAKRPRLDDYRESTQESDDEGEDTDSKESSRSVANVRTASDNDGSWSFSDSGLSRSGAEEPRSGRTDRRWIVRKDSANPSVSSVITEVSDSEINSAMLGKDDDTTCERHNSHRKASQPIDSVIRHMESWSVTHIRALRRNNVYENNRTPGTTTSYRTVVNNAKRDVMRTLRRASGDNLRESNANGSLKDDAFYSNCNESITVLDRSPSPMDEL